MLDGLGHNCRFYNGIAIGFSGNGTGIGLGILFLTGPKKQPADAEKKRYYSHVQFVFRIKNGVPHNPIRMRGTLV
jgi:hypothetical protein